MRTFNTWLNSFTGADSNTIATILITFIIFFLGYLFNGITKLYNGFFVRQQTRKLIKIALLNLIKQVNQQAMYFNKISNSLDIDGVGNVDLQYAILYDLETINTLSYSSIKSCFLDGFENRIGKRITLKQFNILVNSIKFLNEVNKDIVSDANTFTEKFSILNELRNNELTEVQKNIESFRIKTPFKNKDNKPIMEFFKKREEIIAEWRNNPNYLLPTNVNEYVTNLLELNRNNVELILEYEDIIDSLPLNIHINLAILRYKNMSNFTQNKKEQFNYYSVQYFQNREKLLTVYKSIR